MERIVQFKHILPCDIVLSFIYLFIIFIITDSIKRRNIHINPNYKYFLPGLFFKILGGIILCFVYSYYYEDGGDTISYFENGSIIANLFAKNIQEYSSVLFGKLDADSYAFFNNSTGYLNSSLWKSTEAFFVIRLTHFFVLLSFNNFIASTILVAWISYWGIWKLFLLLCKFYPNLNKQIAISFLFIPSVAFWGSGILKDTIIFSAICWYLFSLYNLIVKRKKIILNLLILLISSYVIIKIRYFFFIILCFSSISWMLCEYVKTINSTLVRVMVLIGIVFNACCFVAAFNFYSTINADDEWKTITNSNQQVNEVLHEIKIKQEDFKSGNYGNNYYDIGKIETKISYLLSLSPIAIYTVLFKPYIWETKNFAMALHALENTLLLILFFNIIIKLFKNRIGIRNIVSFISKEPLLFFSLLFVVLLSFLIGISTPLYGAISRFRIPILPFFCLFLFIINDFINRKKLVK